MEILPKTPEELLEIVRSPLELLERAGIHIDIDSISNIGDQLSTDTGSVIPWLQGLWGKAQEAVNGGDVLAGL